MKQSVFSPYVQIFPLVFPRFSQRFAHVLPPTLSGRGRRPLLRALGRSLATRPGKEGLSDFAREDDADDDAAGAQDPESLGEGETSNGLLDQLFVRYL